MAGNKSKSNRQALKLSMARPSCQNICTILTFYICGIYTRSCVKKNCERNIINYICICVEGKKGS